MSGIRFAALDLCAYTVPNRLTDVTRRGFKPELQGLLWMCITLFATETKTSERLNRRNIHDVEYLAQPSSGVGHGWKSLTANMGCTALRCWCGSGLGLKGPLSHEAFNRVNNNKHLPKVRWLCFSVVSRFEQGEYNPQ